MSCLKQHISGGKVPSKLEIHSNNLTSYWIDNIQYVNNTNIELNRELCENMGNVYEGQGTGTLLFDIAENTIGTIPKSTPNNYVFNILVLAKKDRTHIGFINENNTNTDDCVGIDISKHIPTLSIVCLNG